MKEAITAFNQYAAEYDRWFEENAETWEEQAASLRRVIHQKGIF